MLLHFESVYAGIFFNFSTVYSNWKLRKLHSAIFFSNLLRSIEKLYTIQ